MSGTWSVFQQLPTARKCWLPKCYRDVLQTIICVGGNMCLEFQGRRGHFIKSPGAAEKQGDLQLERGERKQPKNEVSSHDALVL